MSISPNQSRDGQAADAQKPRRHSVRISGGRIVVSASTLEAVRALLQKTSTAPTDIPAAGPGTELKKLLGRIGITASPTCGCTARARQMDARGCEWCEANVDTIVGWLREEATKRRLPFLDAAGRVLVRRAISNARKEQARAEAATEGSRKGGSAV